MDNIYELYFWANPQRSHNTGHSATGLFAIFSSPHFFPVVLTSIFLLNYYHSTSIYAVSIWMSALVTPQPAWIIYVLSSPIELSFLTISP